MAAFSLIIGLATLALVIFLFIDNLSKDKASKAFQKEISDQMAQMGKEIKKVGDELSRMLDGMGARSGDSQTKIADSLAGLNALETKLAQLVHSLTNSSSQLPDITTMRSKLSDAQTQVEQISQDLATAKDKAQKFEADFNDANRRILEMEAAETARRKQRGIEPVAPDRASILEAAQRAVELAWDRGATPRAFLAKKAAEEEGGLILKAFDAASVGDAETAGSIVEASSFDPFSFHKDQWTNTVAAKHTLEFARSAAIEGMKGFGFQIDEPRIKVDAYDQNRHDLRDSIPTDQAELKGKIAEVRRLGLIYKGRVVRPARVVQYAIDYRKTPDPIPALQIPTPSAMEEQLSKAPDPLDPNEKRGISDF